MAVLLSGYLAIGSNLLGVSSASAATTASIDTAKLTNSSGGETLTDGSDFRLDLNWSLPDPHDTPAVIDVEMPSDLQIGDRAFDLNTPGGVKIGTCTTVAPADGANGGHLHCALDDAYASTHKDINGQLTISGTVSKGNKETVTDQGYSINGTETNKVVINPKPVPQPCTVNCDYGATGAGKWGSLSDDGKTIYWTMNVVADDHGTPGSSDVVVTDDITGNDPALSYIPGSAKVVYTPLVNTNNEGREYLSGWKDLAPSPVFDGTSKFTFTTPAAIDRTAYEPLQEGQRLIATEDGTVQGIYQLKFSTSVATETKAPQYGTVYYNSYQVTVTKDGTTKTDGATGNTVSRQSSAWGVGTNQGAFSVAKELDGNAASGIAQQRLNFEVRYEVVAPEAHKGNQGSFTVQAGRTATSPYFDEGDTVKITEIVPSDTGAVQWGAPQLADATGKSLALPYEVTFSNDNGTLGKDGILPLKLTNTADLKPTTSFKLQKNVNNPDGVLGLPSEYTVHYDYRYGPDAAQYTKSGSGDITVKADGKDYISSADIPVGAKVTLSEAKPSDTADTTWADPVFAPASADNVYTITADGRLKPTAGDAADHTLVTNAASLRKGTFSITKAMAGTGTELVGTDRDYTGTWSYPAKDGVYAAGHGEWTVKAGATWTSQPVPANAEVTLHENTPQGVDSATWQTPDDQKVTIGENANGAVTFTNTLDHDPGTVTWQKTDATSGAKLSGSEWTLTGPDKGDSKVIQVVDNGAGDEDPEVGALKVSGLAWGNYALTETKAPTGYQVTTQNLKVTIGQNAVDVRLKAIANQRIPGSLTWNKTDATTGDALAGSEWSLVGPDGKATTVVDDGTGDEDATAGALKVSGLAWGDYTLRESKAPAGYTADAEAHTVTIDAANAEQSVSFGTVQNARILGDVSWQKTDATSGVLIGGSEWKLTGPDGEITVVDNGDHDADEAPGRIQLKDLPWGEYTLTESKAPTGYTIAGAEQPAADRAVETKTLVIGADQQRFDLGAITNDRVPGTLLWQKTDGANGTALAGSEWSLRGPDGAISTIVDNGDLDLDKADGRLQLSDLAWGEYTLTESKAPQGYQIDGTAHPVTIDAEHVSIDLGAITNTADPVQPVTNSGDLARTGLTAGAIAAGAALLLAGAALLMIRRRRHAE
ncbi:hypothetical protein F8O09_04760 [Pseudoclavibacter sp. CFCC 11306]|nr:hypothetical protein F8O09_04760 [Pseudoclavibacter sp. CFCC 11306]